MSEITYKIVEHIAVLSTSEKGWTKELNKVSWNDKEPVFDIRSWSADKTKMSKGVTLTSAELEQLKGVL